jgi:hypothetical protein
MRHAIVASALSLRSSVRHAIVTSALVVAVAGCAGRLTRAESEFRAGRYPDAKNAFGALEGESRNWADAERAEYAVYRGLTHAALGDRDQASIWLREAQAIESAHPGSLSHEDAQRLRAGLDSFAPPLGGGDTVRTE